MQLSSQLKKSSGFGLIEVLIAIYIFATGILGIASMQLNGLSMLSNSNALNIAVISAGDMADRIRSNPIGLEEGAYSSLVGRDEKPVCEGVCTPQQKALSDAYDIQKQLETTLNSPSLSVTSVGNGMYTVEIKWQEKEINEWRLGGDDDDNHQVHRFTFIPNV